MGVAQYQGSQDVKTVRRFFVGSTALRKGQILCYQENATKTDAEVNKRLGHAVEAINTDNANFIAGFCTAAKAAKTGGQYVEIEVPQAGDVVLAEVDGTTDIAVGDVLEPDATLGALIDGSEAAGDSLFRALEANTTDATKTAILVYKI